MKQKCNGNVLFSSSTRKSQVAEEKKEVEPISVEERESPDGTGKEDVKLKIECIKSSFFTHQK